MAIKEPVSTSPCSTPPEAVVPESAAPDVIVCVVSAATVAVSVLVAAAPLLALVVAPLVLAAVLLAAAVCVAVEVVCEVDDALVALSSSDAGKPPAWAAVPMATIEPASMYVHGRRILNDPLTIMSLGRVCRETCARQT